MNILKSTSFNNLNKKLLRTFSLVFVCLLLCSHNLYIRLDTYFLEINQEAKLSLYNGTFENSENIITRDRIIDASLLGNGERKSIAPNEWSDKDSTLTQLNFKVGEAGTYVTGVSTKPRNIELSAEKFNNYLEHDGVLDMLARRVENNLLDQDAVESYEKHVKAIYQVGDAKTDDWKTVLGYPIELVPQANPYEKFTGESLDIQLLLDGKPLAQQLVYAEYIPVAHNHDHGDHDHAHDYDGHSHDHAHDGDHKHEHADDHEHNHDGHSHVHSHGDEKHSHDHAHHGDHKHDHANDDAHDHDGHSHEHSHGDETHSHDHAHDGDHKHEHVDDQTHDHDGHSHKHSHGDETHSHDHVHDGEHKHEHADEHAHDHDSHSHKHSHGDEAHSHDHTHDGDHKHDHADDHAHEHKEEGHHHSHDNAQELLTNDQGIVTVEFPEDGIYYVRTIHMVNVTDDETLTHRSKWATLTFEVTHKHGDEGHHHHDHEEGLPIWVFVLGSVLVVGVLFLLFRKKE